MLRVRGLTMEGKVVEFGGEPGFLCLQVLLDLVRVLLMVAEGLLDLRHRLAIPRTLGEIGVDDRQADEVARKAAADSNAPTNPVPLVRRFGQALVDLACWGASLGFCFTKNQALRIPIAIILC